MGKKEKTDKITKEKNLTGAAEATESAKTTESAGSTESPESAESTVVFEDKWFNVEDIAEYLSIKPDTARQWVREGKLPAYKAGKRYKLKLSEVDEWVRSGRITE